MFRSLLFLGWLCLAISGCNSNKPQAIEGKIQLTERDFQQHHTIELVGKWDFYWQQLLTPQDLKKTAPLKAASLRVPSSWTAGVQADKQNYPAYGYATYRLTIALPAQAAPCGLYIPKIWSACKVWVNDSLVLERGKIATSLQGYENQIIEKLIALPTHRTQIDLTVQVANYDIFIAGLLQPFKIGKYAPMQANQALTNGFSLMWLGCLGLMVIYHLILYFYRRKNISVLYFGIACALIALRILVFGEHYFYEYLKEDTGLLTFAWQSKLYYISSFLLIPVALAYIRALYPQETHARIIRICWAVLGTYCLFWAIAPSFLTIPTINVGEALSVIFEVYLVYVLVRATLQNREDALLQMLGIVVMIFASVNDTLHAEEIELVGSIELTPITFAIFLIMQCFIIAKRFSQAFNEVEELKDSLEEKVEERTAELNQTLQLVESERQKSDNLLLNILPEETAQELKETGHATPKHYDLITVLFTDFKGFTHISEKLTPEQVIHELDTCFLAFDGICDKYGLEKIKTIGDAYMCAGGLPIANTTNPIDVVKAGLEMQIWMAKWKAEKEAQGLPAWELRLGIHSGEAVAGVVGKNKFAYDIWGDTVNLASRMESSGEVGKVNISEATYELVKHKFHCTHRGAIEAKNKGKVDMYFVEWIAN